MSTVAAHYAALSRRSITNTIRQPIAIVPAFAFPLMFLALNSAALAESIRLPGFPPVDSFLQFMITTSIIQGGLFGAIAAGSDMARDIEDGFFDRLVATPVSRTSILVARVAGAASLAFVQALVFFLIALPFGLDIEAAIVGNIWLRNKRLLDLSKKLRSLVGPDYPLGAITPDPVKSLYWPNFPYKRVSRIYDVFAPMGYFSFRAHGYKDVKRYTAKGIKVIRRESEDPDVPIHLIGGIGGETEAREVVSAALG